MVVWQMCLILSFKDLDTTKQEKGNSLEPKSESHPLRIIGKKTWSELKATRHFNTGLSNQDTFAWKFSS